MNKALSKKVSMEIAIVVILKNIQKVVKYIKLSDFVGAIIYALDNLEYPHNFFTSMLWDQFSDELKRILPKIIFDSKYEDFIDIIRMEETYGAQKN